MAKRALAALLLAALAVPALAEPLEGQGREITRDGLSRLCVNKLAEARWGALIAPGQRAGFCSCSGERVSAALSKEDVIGIIGGDIKPKDDPRLKQMLEQAAFSCLNQRN